MQRPLICDQWKTKTTPWIPSNNTNPKDTWTNAEAHSLYHLPEEVHQWGKCCWLQSAKDPTNWDQKPTSMGNALDWQHHKEDLIQDIFVTGKFEPSCVVLVPPNETSFSWGKDCERPQDLYNMPINFAPGQRNGLTSCNIGPSIVASNLQISWFLILSSSSWWYLTRFAMLLAWWCQIGQLCVIHFACGLGSSKPCNPPPHYPLRVSGMGGGQTARGHTRGGQTRRGQTRREDTGPGQTGRWQPGWHAMAEQLTPWVGSAAWEGSALGVWFAVGGSLSLGGGSSGGVGLSMGVQMEELGLKGCSYPELSNCPEGSSCPKGPGAQKVQM